MAKAGEPEKSKALDLYLPIEKVSNCLLSAGLALAICVARSDQVLALLFEIVEKILQRLSAVGVADHPIKAST
ncbi:hypothetical protein [Mesorhizobium sp. M1403]|uniref:hypothetical protein n=1 Tax=Mesorhizobium sp. M1403 TaxID=2957097 RepID=UPI00333C9BBB